MCFINKIIAMHKEKIQSINCTCDNYIFQIEKALQEICNSRRISGYFQSTIFSFKQYAKIQ